MKTGYIDVVGTIWLPAITAAYRYELQGSDVENIAAYEEQWFDGKREVTRRAVEHWLNLNAGDFQAIKDFHAYMGGMGWDYESPWKEEENDWLFADLMFGGE